MSLSDHLNCQVGSRVGSSEDQAPPMPDFTGALCYAYCSREVSDFKIMSVTS